MATPQVRHLRSTVLGKLPGPTAISIGQIGVNYNSADPFLCIKDSDGNVRRLGGSTISASAPSNPTNGQLWVDLTVSTAPVLKVWNGTTWVPATYGLKSSNSAPSPAVAGELWVDTSNSSAPILKVYNGATWSSVDTQPVNATTSTAGVVRLATSGDVSAGTADRAVTSDVLKTLLPVAASEANSGLVELATSAETTAGSDTTRAVHPAGLKAALDLKANLSSPSFSGTPSAPTANPGTNDTQIATTAFVTTAVAAGGGSSNVPAATETVAGIVELATAAETASGSDNTRAVHPAGLASVLSGKANSSDVYTRNDVYTKSQSDSLYLPRNITSLPSLP